MGILAYSIGRNPLSAVLLILALTPKIVLAVEYCAELTSFRDQELPQVLFQALENQAGLEDQLDTYMSLREGPLSDANLLELQIVRSADLLLVSLTTLADALKAAVPPAAIASKVAETGTVSARRLRNVINGERTFQSAKSIIVEDAAIAAAKIGFIAETGYVGNMIVGLQEMTTNLISNIERQHEWQSTTESFRARLNATDQIIQDIKQRLAQAESSAQEFNYIKEVIDELCGNSTPTIESRLAMSLAEIGNSIFTRAGSSSEAGTAFNFNNGYADYCVWGEPDAALLAAGDDPGTGNNIRVARINTDSGELEFRPGSYTFSGRKFRILSQPGGFQLLSGNRAIEYQLTDSWSVATFASSQCSQ